MTHFLNTADSAITKKSPYEVVFSQSSCTGFALLERFADQSLLEDQNFLQELVEEEYQASTFPTGSVKEEVEDEKGDELGPSTTGNQAYDQPIPEDSADSKEER